MPAYIDHFAARKKLGPMGLHWGGWGPPFPMVLTLKNNFCFRRLKIGPYDLYSKVLSIGAVVCKLESCSLDPNT